MGRKAISRYLLATYHFCTCCRRTPRIIRYHYRTLLQRHGGLFQRHISHMPPGRLHRPGRSEQFSLGDLCCYHPATPRHITRRTLPATSTDVRERCFWIPYAFPHLCRTLTKPRTCRRCGNIYCHYVSYCCRDGRACTSFSYASFTSRCRAANTAYLSSRDNLA